MEWLYAVCGILSGAFAFGCCVGACGAFIEHGSPTRGEVVAGCARGAAVMVGGLIAIGGSAAFGLLAAYGIGSLVSIF